MHLKRILSILLLAAMVLCLVPASAATYYVYTENGGSLNLRSPEDNKVIGRIPYGAKLETDDKLSTELAAYVTYNGKSGYVKWAFLVKEMPKAKGGKATAKPVGKPAAAVTQRPVQLGEGSVIIQVIGGSVRYASDSAEYQQINYDTPEPVVIKADKKPAYWVIDGIRYDFEPEVPTTITLDNVWEGMTFEAVQKNGQSLTLLSPEDIQLGRTGEALLAEGIHAKLCHLTAKGNGAGGWMDEFDFTDDYTNRATKKKEQGGQVTLRVRSTLPTNKKIAYWLFNDAEVRFNNNVTSFVVRTLNVSMTYEPVPGAAQTAAATKKPGSTKKPTATREPSSVTTRITATPAQRPIRATATPTPAQRPIRATATPTPAQRPIQATATPKIAQRPIRVTATPTPISALKPYHTATPTPGMKNFGDIYSKTVQPVTWVTPTPSPTPYLRPVHRK